MEDDNNGNDDDNNDEDKAIVVVVYCSLLIITNYSTKSRRRCRHRGRHHRPWRHNERRNIDNGVPAQCTTSICICIRPSHTRTDRARSTISTISPLSRMYTGPDSVVAVVVDG
jgi:hypothetical protein